MAALPSSHKSDIEKTTVVHSENIQSSNKDAESQESLEDEKVAL
jgi:hypothetical protein